MSATDAAPPPKPPRRRRGNEFSPTPPPEGVIKTTPDHSPSHLATEKKEAASLIVGAIARRAPPSPPKEDTARRPNGDVPLNGSPSIARRKSENEEKRIEERDERKNGALVPFDYLTKEDKEEPSLADVNISEADNVFTGSGKSSCESSPENQKGSSRHQKATRSKPIALPRSAARKKGSLEDEDEEYDDEEEEEEKELKPHTAPVHKSYMLPPSSNSSSPATTRKSPMLPPPKLLKKRTQSVDDSSSPSDLSQKESPSHKKPIPMPRIQSYDESVLRKYGEQHFNPDGSPKKPTPLPRRKFSQDYLKEQDEEIFPENKSSQSSISEPPSPIVSHEQRYSPPERQELTTVATPTTSLTTTTSERPSDEQARTPEIARREGANLPAISMVPPSPRLTAPPNSPLPVSPISPSTPSAQAAPLAKPLPPPSKPTPPPSPSAKKPRSRQNYTPVKLRTDNSWINKSKTDSPPQKPVPLPRERLPQSASTTQIPSNGPKHAPYRSTPILPQQQKKSDNLGDMSKPVITASGQYLPPGRPVTPDVTSSGLKSPGEPARREEEDVFKESPKSLVRSKKTRRSNSFSDVARSSRPVSLMVDAFSKKGRKDREEALTASASSTVPQDKMQAAMKEEMAKKGKKGKRERNTDNAVKPLPKKMGWPFKRNRTVSHAPDSRQDSKDDSEELTVTSPSDDKTPKSTASTASSDSSEDEQGGTIKRLPKLRHVSCRRDSSTALLSDEVDFVPDSKLFEYVFVLGIKETTKDSKKVLVPEITYQYPPSGAGAKDDAIRSIPQFCYPDLDSLTPMTSYISEHFSFVLTNLEGDRRFGYCRRLLPAGKGPRLPEVYCIISPWGCFDLYEKVLDRVEERRETSRAAVFTFLKAINENPFPRPGRSVRVRALKFQATGSEMDEFTLTRPPDARLEHVDLALLYNTLGPKRIIQVISSLMMERRVVLASSRLSTLSSCCHALLALLYPFEWQHTFIPVLPSSLIDFCCSPMPFIMGINPPMVKQLDHLEIEMEEAVVVDVDKQKFVRRFGDETSILPSKVFQYLEHNLSSPIVKTEYSKPSQNRKGPTKADEIVVNAFLTVYAYFFGDYRKYMNTVDPMTREKQFQREDFLKSFSHSKSTKRFLEAFQLTQMFEVFVEERENPQKAQTVMEGMFEKRLAEMKERSHDIELFSSKRSRFHFGKKKVAPVRL